MELGPVIDQDLDNLEGVQLGMHSDGLPGIQYSRYQEGNIRRMHRLIDELVDAGQSGVASR